MSTASTSAGTSSKNENVELNVDETPALNRGTVARSSILKHPRPQATEVEERNEYDKLSPFFIGAKSLEQLRERGTIFADKTMFIADVIHSNETNLRICIPTGFGKTVNLKMLESFFDAPKYGPLVEDAKELPQYSIFEKTAIFDNTSFVKKYFGKHPVIYMTMAPLQVKTFEDMIKKLFECLAETIEKFRYIYDRLKEPKDAMERSYLNFFENVYEKKLSNGELELSLLTLARIVNYWHEKEGQGSGKVIILLDEYDKPVKNLHDVEDDNERQNIMKFHGFFLSSNFKHNSTVMLTIVAGIFRTALPDESTLDFMECNFLKKSARFVMRHFGFNTVDIMTIREKLAEDGVCIDENHLKLAKRWYDGYTYGNMEDHFYRPTSICRFFNSFHSEIANIPEKQSIDIAKILEEHFVKDSKLENLKELLLRPEIAEQINLLLFGEYEHDSENLMSRSTLKQLRNKLMPKNNDFERISIGKLTKIFSLKEYRELSAVNKGGDATKGHKEYVELFFSYLYHTGYLTIKNQQLCIPNAEIGLFLKRLMIVYYEKIYQFNQEYGNAITDTLRSVVDIGGFDRASFRAKFFELKQNFDRFFKAINLNVVKSEFFPHAILTYLLVRIYGLQEQVYDENMTTQDNETLRMDLSFHLKGTTVIVEMKAGSGKKYSAETAFTEARYYRKLFNGRTDIDRFIFIGISVTKNHQKKISIAYDVVDGRVPAPKKQTPEKIWLNSTHTHLRKKDVHGNDILPEFEEPHEVDCARVPN